VTKPRIHVVGGPGSGKSFVAGELSGRLGVPPYDLDDLFWHRSASRFGIRVEPAEQQHLGTARTAAPGD